MIEGWRPHTESVHLRFGIEYHKGLQYYDIGRANGASHEDAMYEAVRQIVLDTVDWNPDDKYKNRFNLLQTIIWYLDKFDDDPCQTVIGSDGEPAVEVNFKFELDWGPRADSMIMGAEDLMTGEGARRLYGQLYVLCGYLDRVVTFSDELFVMDRKTTKTTPSAYYFNQFEPHNQMTLYTLAGQVIFGATIKGVIIDSAQVTTEFSRFTRGMTYRTKDQIQEWIVDLRYHLENAERYATEGYWPQNDASCDKYGGCAFREVCSKSPGVREVYLKSNFERKERWNPLKPR